MAVERDLQRDAGATVHCGIVGNDGKYGRQCANGGPIERRRGVLREYRAWGTLFRSERLCAARRGAVRNEREEHSVRARSDQPGWESVPLIPAQGEDESSVSVGGLQRDEHTRIRSAGRNGIIGHAERRWDGTN